VLSSSVDITLLHCLQKTVSQWCTVGRQGWIRRSDDAVEREGVTAYLSDLLPFVAGVFRGSPLRFFLSETVRNMALLVMAAQDFALKGPDDQGRKSPANIQGGLGSPATRQWQICILLRDLLDDCLKEKTSWFLVLWGAEVFGRGRGHQIYRIWKRMCGQCGRVPAFEATIFIIKTPIEPISVQEWGRNVQNDDSKAPDAANSSHCCR
jgi:hypothetical protein